MSEFDTYVNTLLDKKVLPVIVSYFVCNKDDIRHAPVERVLELSERLSNSAYEGRFNGPSVGFQIGRLIPNEHCGSRMLDFVRNVGMDQRTPSLDDIMEGRLGYVRLNGTTCYHLAVTMAYKLRVEYRKALPDGSYMTKMGHTLDWFLEHCGSNATKVFLDMAFHRFKLPYDFNTRVGTRFRETGWYDTIFGVSVSSDYPVPTDEPDVELPEVAEIIVPEKSTTITPISADVLAAAILDSVVGVENVVCTTY